MTRWARTSSRTLKIALMLTAASVATACGGSSANSTNTPGTATSAAAAGQTVPTANLPVLQTIGKGEDQL
ncbi:MAG TPA: hypothetical protein VJ254_23285, partial [Streptosporangiaceae bacterium]|nr:hypothetical protein [Streptosporangiaceae bacterium]